VGTIRYEILDIDGRVLFRTDEIDAADDKRLERIETHMSVPDGGAVVRYLDGETWPTGVLRRKTR
jgi:hypothetical protein